MSIGRPNGSLLAGRYRIERSVGRGAMGEVLEVADVRSGQRLALKRPRLDSSAPDDAERARELEQLAASLRHEYLILAQLAHPHVVVVHEYGMDRGLPYYTMELLQGDHPGAHGRLSWRDVCRMLASLCEPLALLHSRRLVHRDLSARNVFVSEGGLAKLIDFGAIASMGAHHRPIGTPACMAPEVWRREQLDARADVFGLGALAYFALTAQHAYPSRTLGQLPLAWHTPPAPPSEHFADVPHALDQLILSMLSLDAVGRPSSVAEVFERLRSVSDVALTTSWVAPPAALPRPDLVGRERQLELARGLAERASAGHGQTFAIRGSSGTGRTRILEVLGERAEIAGMAVVRASAGTLGATPFALVRDLAHALALLDTTAPPLDPPLSLTFDAALSQLRGDQPPDPRPDDESLELQGAFMDACERRAAVSPLYLVIDDIDRGDPASLRVLLQLARRASARRLVLALASTDAEPEDGTPLRALLREALRIDLTGLEPAHTEALVQSMVGDVPNVSRVARWVHDHAGGSPGSCVALLEYLMSAGAIRFRNGRWELQEDLDALRLSSSAGDELERTLLVRSAGRELLEVLSLVVHPFPLELSLYAAALPEERRAAALDDLVRSQQLLATSQGYVLRDFAALGWIRERLEAEHREELHAALARVYADYGERQDLQVAYHTWHAGDHERADRIVRRLQGVPPLQLQRRIWESQHRTLPTAFLEALLAYRKQRGCASADLHGLRAALLTYAWLSDIGMLRYAHEMLDQLGRDVGLDLWEQTDASAPPVARAFQCFELADARHRATPPEARGLPVETAIHELIHTIAVLQSPAGFVYDVQLLRTLQLIMTPLRELSPTSRLIADTVQLSHDSYALGEKGTATHRTIIAASAPDASPDVDQDLCDGIHHVTSYYLGMELAAVGQDEALALASKLEAHPLYEELGLHVRRMHALGCGRLDEAQRCRRRRELLALRTARCDNILRFSLLRDVQAAHLCGDVLELGRLLPELEALAATYEGWRPWAALARAFLQLRSDETAAACEVLERALDDLPPFSHRAWHNLMATLAELRNERKDYARARELAATTLEGAAGLGLNIDTVWRLRASLALAEAGLGDTRGAADRIDALIGSATEHIGRRSVAMGMLRETACQIALLAKDYNGFSAHVDAMGELYAHHPGLRARHARWVRKGRERFRKLLAVLEKANAAKDWSAQLARNLQAQPSQDASRYLLAFVLDQLQIEIGQLYRVDAERRIELLACRPEGDEPTLRAGLRKSLENWWSSEEQTADDGTETANLRDAQGRSYVPLWLTNPARPEEVTGVVLAGCDPERLAQLSPAFVRAVAEHLDAL